MKIRKAPRPRQGDEKTLEVSPETIRKWTADRDRQTKAIENADDDERDQVAMQKLVDAFKMYRDPINWVPESENQCIQCGERFGMFQRWHHCRFCGGLVHANHSKKRVRVNNTKHRACDRCYAIPREVSTEYDII